MPVTSPVMGAAGQNILRDAVWSGTAPAATYELDTLIEINPAARIRFGGSSATITATISSSRGDVLAIPCTNASSLTLTNGAGLNEVITIPTLPASRRPKTIVADLSVLEPNAATRTSTTWTFAFSTGDPVLILGGAILIFNPRTDMGEWDIRYGGSRRPRAYGVAHVNDYGSRYLQTFQSGDKSVSITKRALEADKDAIEDWFETAGGPYGVSLLWLDPDVNDAMVGTADDMETTTVSPSSGGVLFDIRIGFSEMSKGQPV